VKRIIDCSTAIAFIVALFLCSTPALAQDDSPIKREGVKYVQIEYVTYKPDKRSEAREIIEDHFVPAGEKANLPGPTLVIHLQTGDWNEIIVWPLEEGMANLEWIAGPSFVKWKAALDEQEGGADKANELMRRFDATIARRRFEVGHHHVGAN